MATDDDFDEFFARHYDRVRRDLTVGFGDAALADTDADADSYGYAHADDHRDAACAADGHARPGAADQRCAL